jgi:Zn-dependent protease
MQLARVFGIRVGVDASWFFVLFFFIYVLSGTFRASLDTSETVAYLTAVAAVMLFFASLVMHELGHALMARRLGIGIVGIDLWFFGGLAKMDRDADSPGTEFKVAVAGPLVTLAVVAACVGGGVAVAGSEAFQSAVPIQRGASGPALLQLTAWLALINTALFLFNLLPAFPLDGGRIARAVAWKLTGSRLKATRLAAFLGQGFAYLLAGLGIYSLILDDITGGLWLIVLAWFLGQAARSAVFQTVFTERLGGVTVADVMDREPVAIPATLTGRQAEEEFFLRYGWPWFPVVDERGHPIGVLQAERVSGAGADERPVSELMDGEASDARVEQDAPLEALLGSEPLQRVGALLAVDGEGVLRGVVTRDQVRRALATAAARGG